MMSFRGTFRGAVSTILLAAAMGLFAPAEEAQETPINDAPAPNVMPGTEQAAAPPPEIVARVGTEIITGAEFAADLKYRAKRIERESGRPPRVDRAFKRATLNELIDGRLLRMQAITSGITVSEEEVRREFEVGKAGLGQQEAYTAYLQELGLTEAGLLREIRNRLIVEKFVREQTKDLSIPEETLEQEYERRKLLGQYMRVRPTADVANILLYAPENESGVQEQARKKAEAAHARILAGEPFEEVAKQVSEDRFAVLNGGTYREIVPAQVLPEAAAVIAGLQPGEVSKPFLSQRGWQIIKLIARNDPGTIPYDKVKDGLRAELLIPKRQETLQKVIDQIKMIVHIEVYEAKAE